MRMYSFITGLISVFLVVLAVLTVKTAFPLALLFLLIPAAYFAFALFINKWGNNKVAAGLLVFLSVFINLVFLLSLVVMILNYPPQKSFEEKMVLQYGTEQEEAIYMQLNNAMKAFNQKFKMPSNPKLNTYEYTDKGISLLLESTEASRKEIMGILIKTPFSIPDRYYKVQLDSEEVYESISPENEMYHTRGLLSLFKIELTDINRLLSIGDYNNGVKRYTDL